MTKTNGLPGDGYITIRGESYDAVLKGDEGDGSDHMFDVQHEYYMLDGFTIDGDLGGDRYQDKCLYVQTNRDDGIEAKEIEFNGHSFKSSINGMVIANMDIKNCGGECVRMRYFITYAQVDHRAYSSRNVYRNCRGERACNRIGTRTFLRRRRRPLSFQEAKSTMNDKDPRSRPMKGKEDRVFKKSML